MAGLLNTIFIICLAFAILFFVISVVLFFLFDIPMIFSIRTGRAAAKSIKDMEQANSDTGRLRVGKVTNTGNIGKKKGKTGTLRTPGTPVIQPPAAAPAPAPQYAPTPQYAQPEPSYDSGETSMLTTQLDQGGSETALLQQQPVPAPAPAPAAPVEQPAYEAEEQLTEELTQYAETSVLSEATRPAAFEEEPESQTEEIEVFFDVIKKIIVRDTDEIIR